MVDAFGKETRDIWAEATAAHIVDGALSASDRSGGQLPNADQIALLRAIATRSLWHLPNSSDEVRGMARRLYLEGLHQPHLPDDDPPGG